MPDDREFYKPEIGVELTAAGARFDVAAWRASMQAKLDTIYTDMTKVEIPLTAFGDLRTAEITPILQATFEYTVDNTEINEKIVTAGGTVTQADAMAVLSTSTTTGSDAIFRSETGARYRAGVGGLMRFTALFENNAAGTESYMGLADEAGSSEAFKNGLMVGYDGTTFGLHRFQNDTKISVVQSAWDDPMDGTGESGMTLDQTKLNVYGIGFQYLGSGKIQLLLEDDSTGLFVVAHTILYANNFTVPSVYNPNFNCTMWVDNKATTTDIVLKSASYAYFVEGQTQYTELHQPQQFSNEIEKTSVTALTAIFTIRNKALYASKTNFIDIILEHFTTSIEASSANNLGEIHLVKNATLGGTPAYADINTNDSVVDIDTAGTTVTGGKDIFGTPLAGKNDRAHINLLPYRIIIEPGDTVTVAAESAASATINASLLWKELF